MQDWGGFLHYDALEFASLFYLAVGVRSAADCNSCHMQRLCYAMHELLSLGRSTG